MVEKEALDTMYNIVDYLVLSGVWRIDTHLSICFEIASLKSRHIDSDSNCNIHLSTANSTSELRTQQLLK